MWNRWHHFENLAAYEYDIWFYRIRNKNGPPKDILGWFRAVEIFMWSNVRVIVIYLIYNELGYQMELFWLQLHIYLNCYSVMVSGPPAVQGINYMWLELINIIAPIK